MISETELSRLFAELHCHLRELFTHGKIIAWRDGKSCHYSVSVHGTGRISELAVIGPLEIEYRSKNLRNLARDIVGLWRATAMQQGASS